MHVFNFLKKGPENRPLTLNWIGYYLPYHWEKKAQNRKLMT